MALTDLTRISTAGIATGTSLSGAILHGDAHFRGNQVGVNSAIFDSSERELNFKDNVKLTFGDATNGDLRLYHQAPDNYILSNSGTTYIRHLPNGGDIKINATNIHLTNHSNNQTLLKTTTNGPVQLYHAGNPKFQTTSTGAVVTGILTATGFSGPTNNTSGIATFYDLRVSNNLTVEGSTTTLDTNLIGVDRVEVGANSNTLAGIAVTQSGSADIVRLFDGTSPVVTVNGVGRVGINTTTPRSMLDVKDTIHAGRAIHFDNSAWTGEVAGKIQLQSNFLHIMGGTNGVLFRNLTDGNVWEIDSHLSPVTDSLVNIGYSNRKVKTIYSDQVGIADTIFHVGDTDTKIRFPSADTIQFETGGSNKLSIGSSITSTTAITIYNADPELTFRDSNHSPFYYSFKAVGGAFNLSDSVNGDRMRFSANGSTSVVAPTFVMTGAAQVSTNLGVTGNLILSDQIQHDGDTDTRIRFPGPDQITLEAGGNRGLYVDPNGNLVKSASGGVGNASVYARDLFISGSGYKGITIHTTSTSGNRGGCIFFGEGTSVPDMASGIIMFNHNSNSMHFSTGGSTNVGKSLRINGVGDVRFDSTPTSNHAMSVIIKSHKSRVVDDNNGIVFLDGVDHTQAVINVQKKSTSNASSDLVFRTSSGQVVNTLQGIPERLRITSDGQVLIGTSIPTTFRYTGTGHPYNNNNYTIHSFSNIGLVGQYSTINMPMDHSAATTAGNWWMLGRSAGTTNEWGLSTRPANSNNLRKVWRCVTRSENDGILDYQSFHSFTGTESLRIDNTSRTLINNRGNAMPGLSANADDLVIGYGTESNETGITMYSTTASGIRFNDNSGTDGAIEYAHGDRELRFNAANGVRLAFSVNAANSPVFNMGVSSGDYNNHNKGDRASVKVGDYLSIESATGAGHNSRAGLGYNCYFHSLEDFYCGTNSPSGGDNRPAAYGMAYGNHYFYSDASNTAHSAQAQLTMSRVMEILRDGDVKITDGDLVIGTAGHGIDFSATANGGTGTPSELLDDYEEGYFAPTVRNLSSGYASGTFYNRQARYTKVGNMVTCWVHLQWWANATTTDNSGNAGGDNLELTIEGFPFEVDGVGYSGSCGGGLQAQSWRYAGSGFNNYAVDSHNVQPRINSNEEIRFGVFKHNSITGQVTQKSINGYSPNIEFVFTVRVTSYK